MTNQLFVIAYLNGQPGPFILPNPSLGVCLQHSLPQGHVVYEPAEKPIIITKVINYSISPIPLSGNYGCHVLEDGLKEVSLTVKSRFKRETHRLDVYSFQSRFSPGQSHGKKFPFES